MSETMSVPIPITVQEDFIETFGWERLVKEMGGERAGMQDAWNAVRFATPKGRQAKTCTVRVHPGLVPVLLSMMEVRWADHFNTLSELEAPYDRVISKLADLKKRKGKK